MYTASKLIERARSIADLPNAKFISYDDELQSLNEAYRDVYNWLSNNNDDYYAKTATITLTHADLTQPGTYYEDLPADMYKLRFIDYMDQGHWVKMRKFAPEARTSGSSSPRYRFLGDQIWIIGAQQTNQIKITYYPPAESITLPDYAYSFCNSVEPYNKSLINAPQYVALNNSMIYVYNGTSIRVESITNNTVDTPTSIYTSTGLSKAQYFKGYIYFLKGGEIYRATTNLVSTITPTAITSTAGAVVDYTINSNEIIYSTATETYEANLDGSGATLAANHASTQPCLIAGQLAYINAMSELVVANVSLIDDVTYLTTDGVYLYYVNTLGELRRVSLTPTFAVETNELLRSDVSYVGSSASMRLPIVTTDDEVMAISSIYDWVFSYPLNEVNEVMAYQCAIDFKRKQNADYSQLDARKNELLMRILDVFKRDEGLPQRIGNAYDVMDSNWR